MYLWMVAWYPMYSPKMILMPILCRDFCMQNFDFGKWNFKPMWQLEDLAK